MSKELEALEDLKECWTPCCNDEAICMTKGFYLSRLDIIETALKEKEKQFIELHNENLKKTQAYIEKLRSYIKGGK